MKASTLDRLIWPAIYVGLVIGGFGLSLRDDNATIAWVLIGIGTASIIGGAVMIALRARKLDP
jgi:cyanate permease